MARWKPNTTERLVQAALDLFAEQGYESTTVTEIAERAGLTKSTFFRYFTDKREVLFGVDTMSALLVQQIGAAPASAGPLEALGYGLDSLGNDVFRLDRREFAARRRVVIAANSELLEREALKSFVLIDAITAALKLRGVNDLTARIAAQLGVLALKIAYNHWSDATCDQEFATICQRTIIELQAASDQC